MDLHRIIIVTAITLSSLLHLAASRGGESSSSASGSLRQLFEEKKEIDDVAGGYMTNADLEKAVKVFGKRCSNISRVYSIGKSVNGVPLWVIEISDNPGVEEPEPAFKYIGNVHGDEPVGRELLLLLANWICDNYMNDPLVKLVVEKVHLHILPSMNPDGFSLKTRGNANNVDLNRDFPDQFFTNNDDMDARQPETRAIMKWLREIQFTASASLHGGALVANYPWDGTRDMKRDYYGCPDDQTFRYMASLYSRSHYNMSSSKEFQGGITNGAEWYPIYGGMQDWNYIHAGCFELTLEISDNKWPSAKELPTIWEYNKMSMLNLVANVVKTGVHGRIFSSDSGKPLPGSVTIKGIEYMVQAGKAYADYHRPLAPGGKYEVMAIMPGYEPKITSISLDEAAASVDFILDPKVTTHGNISPSRYYSIYSSETTLGLVDVLGSISVEIYLILIVILAFLSFLFRRRIKFGSSRRKQSGGPTRIVMV